MRSTSESASSWYSPQNSPSLSARLAGASERNVWIETSGLLISCARPAASVPSVPSRSARAHLLARAAQLVDEPRVLDRDRRLRREALEQQALVGLEARPAAPVVDRERADHALLPDERHEQHLVGRDLGRPSLRSGGSSRPPGPR